MVSIEQHAEWISGLLVHARENEIVEIEADLDEENAWVEHVNDLAAATLYPKANSWFLGADIPGKPRVFMPYSGGLRASRRKCNEVAAADYQGFVLRSASVVDQ
jgi:cyclohexanone monooxygenase